MTRPVLQRSDGGPLVAAIAAVAAAGALACYLLPSLAVALIVVAALAAEAGARELRIRRRLRKLGPANRPAVAAAPLHIESGAL